MEGEQTQQPASDQQPVSEAQQEQPIPKKSSNSRNSRNKYIVIALLIILPLTTFFLGIWIGSNYQLEAKISFKEDTKESLEHKESDNEKSPDVTDRSNHCLKNGRESAESILIPYTVKGGDSLLSIATNELGDPSRIQELAVMNGDKYSSLFSSPGVVSENAFIEQGWKFLLPPDWITDSSGQLEFINGLIIRIRPENEAMEISWRKDSSGHYATITLDDETINSNTNPYKEGDCISSVRDIRMGKTLKIELQDDLESP